MSAALFKPAFVSPAAGPMMLGRVRASAVFGLGDMTAAGLAKFIDLGGGVSGPYTGSAHNRSIRFPDRVITANLGPFLNPQRFLRYWREHPISPRPVPVTEQTRQNFLICNWLLRPPLTDAEILIMPLGDLLNLYYNLAVGVKCGEEPKAHPIASRGLPHTFAVANDRQLQARIYALRTELHAVADLAGNSFPVLVPPDSLQVPECDETDTMIQGLSALASLAAFGVGAVVGAAIATAISLVNTTISQVVRQIDIAKIEQAAATATGQAKAILNGIKTSIALHREPALTDSIRANLLTNYQNWQNVIAQYEPIATGVNTQWAGLPWPEITIPYWYSNPPNWLAGPIPSGTPAIETDNAITAFFLSRTGSPYFNPAFLSATPGGHRYAADWTPYRKFFYSDAVAQMVLTPAQQETPHVQNAVAAATNLIAPPVSSPAGSLAPTHPVAVQTAAPHPAAAIGLGLGALLLLLL